MKALQEQSALLLTLFGANDASCGRGNASRPEPILRVRLCAKCWDKELVGEGPDEPDPAFVQYFPGTKRYTPRIDKGKTSRQWRKHRAFFFEPSLQATSDWLQSLFEPYMRDDMDDEDFEKLWLSPPADVRAELERRHAWLFDAELDARRIESYIDVAKQLDPLENPVAFASALENAKLARPLRTPVGPYVARRPLRIRPHRNNGPIDDQR
ncbi:hypothetical protein OIV83_003944 [Microbotryomycetes sp. JL201]|nr:hypothetical protein OIV83_003944 [Microbotryomycetes sp. JL201]